MYYILQPYRLPVIYDIQGSEASTVTNKSSPSSTTQDVKPQTSSSNETKRKPSTNNQTQTTAHANTSSSSIDSDLDQETKIILDSSETVENCPNQSVGKDNNTKQTKSERTASFYLGEDLKAVNNEEDNNCLSIEDNIDRNNYNQDCVVERRHRKTSSVSSNRSSQEQLETRSRHGSCVSSCHEQELANNIMNELEITHDASSKDDLEKRNPEAVKSAHICDNLSDAIPQNNLDEQFVSVSKDNSFEDVVVKADNSEVQSCNSSCDIPCIDISHGDLIKDSEHIIDIQNINLDSLSLINTEIQKPDKSALKPQTLMKERQNSIVTVSDQSDPLSHFEKHQDDTIFHSSETLKEEESKKKRQKIKQVLNDQTLNISPYVNYDVPYLESQTGAHCALRGYFPTDVYWSLKLDTSIIEGKRKEKTDNELESKMNGKRKSNGWNNGYILEPHSLVTCQLSQIDQKTRLVYVTLCYIIELSYMLLFNNLIIIAGRGNYV